MSRLTSLTAGKPSPYFLMMFFMSMAAIAGFSLRVEPEG
jgi:hypothetical protein